MSPNRMNRIATAASAVANNFWDALLPERKAAPKAAATTPVESSMFGMVKSMKAGSTGLSTKKPWPSAIATVAINQ